MNKFIVITTINEKSGALSAFEKKQGWHIVVVGDRKTPDMPSTENFTYLSIDDQLSLGFSMAALAPYNHYARKNIGYLYAIQSGADIIYDTDDDNWPTQGWGDRDFECQRELIAPGRYVNVYRHFSDEHIWPRGFPLEKVSEATELAMSGKKAAAIGVWQGLVDLDPDVDAIYRLVLGKEVVFRKEDPVFLRKRNYCPFNSQNTFWNAAAFPYLYLPATTSFRFTDILRGYIAQRLMWADNLHLGFMPSSVEQERNPHDLMKDLADEVECYLGVTAIVDLLESLEFGRAPIANMKAVYAALAQHGFVQPEELPVCEAWLDDLSALLVEK